MIIAAVSGFFPEEVAVQHPVRGYYLLAGAGLAGIGEILAELRDFKKHSR